MNSERLRAWSREWGLAIAIAVALTAWFVFTRLSFAPVPWPDASAFYLPGLDLVNWPPSWQMRAQAAFVPSYYEANFNTMPLLPLLLGLAERLGLTSLISPTQATRVISMIGLFLLAAMLRRLFRNSKVPAWMALATLAALLFDPVIRWGTLVVRTETWIGLCWALILVELWKLSSLPALSRRQAIRLGGWLALGAGFHFEAIVLVPGTAIGLLAGTRGWPDWKEWLRRNLRVGLWTLVFLSPWILYALWNFGVFLEQMDIQFHRLEQGNRLIESAYAFFHSLFISHGSAVSWPKFFNSGKGVFWILIALLTGLTLWHRRGSVLVIAGALTFYTTLYLWITKPEVWFITQCHWALWCWVALFLLESSQKGDSARDRWRVGVASLTLAYAGISLAATATQHAQIPADRSWTHYDQWVTCIERSIGRKLEKTGRQSPSVWQPHVPDVLVDLAHRHPRWQFTRALDFYRNIELAWELTKTADVILYTTHFNRTYAPGEYPVYVGPLRDQDRERLKNWIEVPFGSWLLDHFPELYPGVWETQVCQVGPFWATLALRNPRP